MPQPAATEHPDAPTVGQLCKVLARFPDDHVAVPSQDADGRAGRVPADDVAAGMYALTDEDGRAYAPHEAMARDADARQRFSAIPKDAIRAADIYPAVRAAAANSPTPHVRSQHPHNGTVLELLTSKRVGPRPTPQTAPATYRRTRDGPPLTPHPARTPVHSGGN